MAGSVGRLGGLGARGCARTKENTTMRRRNLLIGMGSLAAGGAATIGTGAFTSVSADRSVTVDVADDANAFLSLTASDGPNAEYVDDSGNTLEVAIDERLVSGSGLNEDARTVIRDVLQITNQGTQDIFVWVDNDTIPDGVGIFSDAPAETPTGNPDATTGLGDNKEGDTDDAKRDSVDLPPVSVPVTNEIPVGQTMDEIGFSFNTGSRGGVDSDFNVDITIEAREVTQYSDY